MEIPEGGETLVPSINHSVVRAPRLDRSTEPSLTEHSDYILPFDYYDSNSDIDNYTYYWYYYNQQDPHYHRVEEGLRIYRTMLIAGIIPLCVVGVAANAVSFWVWNACKNPTMMMRLFQALAVLDNLFLLGSAIRGGWYYSDPHSQDLRTYTTPVLYLSHAVTVHLTAVIGGVRWLTVVARPRRTHAATKRLVLMTCCGLGAWCALLTAGIVVTEEKVVEGGERGHAVAITVLQLLGFVVPTLVLLAFSAALLYFSCRRRRLQSTRRLQKTTLAVLSIAFVSFLACPVGVTGHLLAYFASRSINHGCNWTCIMSAFGAGELFQVLNSSVNFLFYFFFASKFRPLLKHALCCCVPEPFRARLTGFRRFSPTSTNTELDTDSTSSLADDSTGTSSQTPVNATDRSGRFFGTAAAEEEATAEENCLQETCTNGAIDSGTAAAVLHATGLITENAAEDVTSL